MRAVFLLVLVVGIGLAGFAVYMAKNYIGAYQQQLEAERANRGPQFETVPVFVAKTALKYGDKLTKDNVAQVLYPANALPEGVFKAPEELFPPETDDPRTVLRTIEAREVILAVKVTEPGEDAGITSRLERGMRAFAIKVDVTSGVSGFLRPGDRVDVYWTGRVSIGENAGGSDVTKLIEANIPLIAVDQKADGDTARASIARTVTVAVRPQQVAALAQAQSTGRLSLSLVGSGDDTISETIEVDQRSLLGIAAAPKAKVEAKKEICTIRTRRGADVIEMPIPCTN